MEKVIVEIEQGMASLLNNFQSEELHKVLIKNLQSLTFLEKTNYRNTKENEVDYCNLFICAKRVEGCSEKSIKYYKSTIDNMLKTLKKPVKHITTEDLRNYLSEYHKRGNSREYKKRSLAYFRQITYRKRVYGKIRTR